MRRCRRGVFELFAGRAGPALQHPQEAAINSTWTFDTLCFKVVMELYCVTSYYPDVVCGSARPISLNHTQILFPIQHQNLLLRPYA